jgi:hypothetical protein
MEQRSKGQVIKKKNKLENIMHIIEVQDLPYPLRLLEATQCRQAGAGPRRRLARP